jgi:RES domain-containing protein
MKRYAISAFLILGACATPQERCINNATRDIQIVDRLIEESQATLARGYALERETIYRTEFQDCTPEATERDPKPRPRMCTVEVPQTVMRPKSVDLKDESAKLASLESKRATQAGFAKTSIAQCRSQFPE